MKKKHRSQRYNILRLLILMMSNASIRSVRCELIKKKREKSKHFDNYYREKMMTAIKKECRMSGVWRQMARRPMKIVIRIKRPCTGIITRKITGACQVCSICPFCAFTKPYFCCTFPALRDLTSPNIYIYTHDRCII